MTRHCAFLTMNSLEGYVSYDELAVPPLNRLGWDVDFVSWRDTAVNWDDYELVVVRTTWDYQDDPGLFLDVLARIDASRARLENALHLIRWNLHKSYLLDLEARGVRIVPTVRVEPGCFEAGDLFHRLGRTELIVKPAVGANAGDTFRLAPAGGAGRIAEIQTAFAGREALVQPFLPSVLAEGEYSLFYFGGRYSHAIVKTPRPGDFRVQEEHGGEIRSATSAHSLRRIGQQVLDCLDSTPLYARVDLLRHEDDYALIELELIEPSLYFEYDARSPARFARALHARMSRRGARA